MGTILPAAALRTPRAYGSTPVQLNVIRSAAASRGGVAYAPRVYNPAITPSDLVSMHSRLPAAGTYLGELTDARLRSWRDQLSDPGSGELTLDYDDTYLPSLLLDGNDLVTHVYRGVAGWTQIVTKRDKVIIAQDEESAENSKFSGPGHLSVLARALLFPSRGPGAQPIEEDRPFDWTAVAYPDASWSAPYMVGTIGDARRFAALLWSFSDPTAPEADPATWARGMDIFGVCPLWWNYGATLSRARPLPLEAGGTCYFRQPVTIPSTGVYDIWITCAANMDLFVDGQHIVGTSSASSYLNTANTSLTLSVGVHTFAWSATAAPDSLAIWGLGFNAGFGTFQVYKPGGFSGSPVFIAQADGSARFVPYAPQPPGMTPGRAMLIALREAQARGKITYVQPMFSEIVDSNGNPWPSVPDIATKVGYDLVTFFQELAATYIDFWMQPGTTKLYAWRLGERGRTRPVTLQPGNLAGLESELETPIAGTFLAKSSIGWTVHGNGETETLLGLGAITSPAEVDRVAEQQLVEFSETREQLTATADGDEGNDVYVDYLVGDTIDVDES